MKQKIFTLLLKTLFLLLFVVGIGNTGWGQKTIVSFTLTTNNVATGGITGNTGVCTLTENTSGTPTFDVTDGAGVTNWLGTGPFYWQTSFITTGYYNISLQASVRSDNRGPRDFIIEWSTDGTNFFTATATSVLGNPYSLTTNAQNPSVYLPANCNNKSIVYIRWKRNSTSAVNTYPILATSKSYINDINVYGLSQAYNITFQSNSSSTITASWVNEAPNTNCVVIINSSNSFTTPADGTNPSANASYTYGSGEQVVYNGQNTSVLITVSDLTQAYWVRVYNYSLFYSTPNAYIYVPASGSNNPMMASFPVVINPTVANIVTGVTATTADVGGEITSNGGSPIAEKGIYYSITSTVTTASNKYVDNTGSSPWIGAFSSNQEFSPNTKYYFRAYAYNGFGTSLTSTLTSFYTPAIKPSRHVYSFYVSAATVSSLTLNWEGLNAAEPSVTVDGYLIIMRQGAVAPTWTPTNGVQYAVDFTSGSDKVVANIVDGWEVELSTEITGLTAETQYSFTIVPYGGQVYDETFVYRTDATIPSTEGTTGLYHWIGANNEDWQVLTNWNPNRTTPDVTDILHISNVGTRNITNVPTETVATITIDGNTFVTLNPASSADVLTISGALTINSGSSLFIAPGMAVTVTVTGTLTNNAGTTGLKILSTAAGTGMLMHNNAGVQGTIQRYVTGTNNLYHLVSVPINTASTPLTSNVFLYSYLARYDEAGGNWDQMGTPTNNTIETGRGYLTYDPTDATETYSFPGQLNYAAVDMSVSYSIDKGWNLVGNPYPSNIDWDIVEGWTKTNLYNTVYVWNAPGNKYGTYVGGVANNGGSNLIATGQAFFVRANAAGPALQINSAARTTSAVSFLKEGNSIQDILRITANLNNYSHELVVRFKDEATDEFDGDYDAYHLSSITNAVVPDIYTVDASDVRYSINAVPYSGDEKIITMAYKSTGDGLVTLNASELESFNQSNPNIGILLEDLKTGTFTALKQHPTYSFTYYTTDDPLRFKLHFGEALGVSENDADSKKCSVYVVNSDLFIQYNAFTNQTGIANLYDVQGRLMETFVLDGSGSQQFQVSTRSGVYMVKLTFEDYIETHKIAIR